MLSEELTCYRSRRCKSGNFCCSKELSRILSHHVPTKQTNKHQINTFLPTKKKLNHSIFFPFLSSIKD
ncbi:hypothetical protein L1987_31502 [Smallanthus sonchifolius]|uniref:Uncharacterized protein n=1 Tax=Smallanthus sonchifolius TaxID=185202 RepID=A0ACB9I7A4_9ASTR|nr:hypothetical protein L1987_31502 [Smallanthus sonchifolius]